MTDLSVRNPANSPPGRFTNLRVIVSRVLNSPFSISLIPGETNIMLQPFVETHSLTKRFGSFTALDGCSVSINQGEVFGLLGPNGAGKSTLIRLLMGFLNPTSGSATISGLDCHRQRVAVHDVVSYLPGDARLFRTMTGHGVLKLFARFRPKMKLDAARAVANRLELDLNRWVAFMSTGMRQKLALAIALSNDAPMLILDEPTANLDPTVRGRVIDMVAEAKASGKTVMFSSHVLSEIEDVCDRVAILRAGKLVFQQSLADLKQQHRIRATLHGELPNVPAKLGHSLMITRKGDSVQIETPSELAGVLKWLSEAPLQDVFIQPIGLRAVYDRFHCEDSVGPDQLPGNESTEVDAAHGVGS